MRSTSSQRRVSALLAGAAVTVPLALTGMASAAAPAAGYAAPIHGTVKGFASGDFTFLDAVSTSSINLAQLSVAQSAAGVSNRSLQTTDTLGQDLLTTKTAKGKSAYARGAGVSINLGQGSKTIPQAQLTQAEAVSPPVKAATTDRIVHLPLSPVADVDVQPDKAQANTVSADNFCVLGKPLSEGTSTVADASVLPVASGISVVGANGTVRNDSTEALAPNGSGAFGLSSVSTLHTVGITLFKGIPGAAITIKVLNPLFLQAFAGGTKSSSKVVYGSGDGAKDVLAITAAGQTVKLTAEQLIGKGGVKLNVDGLLRVTIGGKPTVHLASNGTTASALADLVSVQVISLTPNNSGSSVGGPLGPILNPILKPVVQALDQLTSQIDGLLTSLGLTKGVDLRIGHFEANAQVPVGGIRCGLPVHKTVNKDPVAPGDHFTVTITTRNPYDCVLRHVRVDDKITATGGVKWTVGDTRPKADTVTNSEVIWNDIGDIQPHGKKSVEVDIGIDADSATGRMSDTSTATAGCGTGTGTGTTTVHLTGTYTLHAPTIAPGKTGPLPNTGMSPALPVTGAVLLAAGLGVALLRRRTS